MLIEDICSILDIMKISIIKPSYIFMLSFILTGAIGSYSAVAQKSPNEANLIILIDYGQSEELLRISGTNLTTTENPFTPLGALTSTLIPALYQQAAPLLVSRSLLTTVMHRKQIFHDCLTLSCEELHKLYGNTKITKAASLEQFKRHCLYAETMYKTIAEELKPILKTGSAEEIDTAINTLTSKKPYLEEAAPRSLQYYSCPTKSTKEILHRELQGYALCYYAPLSLEDYCIKEVSNELILLIPRTLCGAHDTSYKGGSSPLTTLELNLGCKLNHLKDIATPTELLKKYPITHTLSLSSALSQIVVTRKEGGTNSFVIYLAGHGLPAYPERLGREYLKKLSKLYQQKLALQPHEKILNDRKFLIDSTFNHLEQRLSSLSPTDEKIINSLSYEEFQRVLAFIDKEISCSLLLYTSCFAGGEHLIIPYQGATKTLSYDCIVVSVSDTISFQDSPMLLLPPYKCSTRDSKNFIEGITEDSFDLKKKRLKPYTSTCFDQFFSLARCPQRSAEQLVNSLHPYIFNGMPLVDYLENVPHIRTRGSSSFKLIETSPTLGLLPTQGTISSQLQFAFLDSQVYGSLTLPRTLRAIISLTPGAAFHIFDRIETTVPLTQFAKNFLKLPSLPTPKLFWIKELRCKDATVLFPLEMIRRFFGSGDYIHDLIIARNIPTTSGLCKRVSTNIYFSDARGVTWHIPVEHRFGKASRVDKTLLYDELFTLMPELASHLKKQH